MSKVEIVLPFPPSVNRYWRNVNGRAILSREAREYRKAVADEVGRQKGVAVAGGYWWGSMPGALAVEIMACPPDRRRRDLDNMLKGVLDALQHANVYKDDSQIADLRIFRGEVKRGGELMVTVRQIERAQS